MLSDEGFDSPRLHQLNLIVSWDAPESHEGLLPKAEAHALVLDQTLHRRPVSLPAPLYAFFIPSEMNRVRVSLAVSGFPGARRGATLQVRACRRPRPTRLDLERPVGTRSLAAR